MTKNLLSWSEERAEMTAITDDDLRDSMLEIRRSRKWRMIVVLLGLLAAGAVGLSAVLLAHEAPPDAAQTPKLKAQQGHDD